MSIVLPTYCRYRTGQLQRALESVLTQTFEDFEFLVIDDGSTDGSADLIERLRAKDPRVVHIRHERNSGIHSVRLDEGIELARGKYLAFQFDDDRWRPNALKTLVRTIEQANRPCVVVGKAFFTGPVGTWTLPAVELNLITLYEQNRFAHNAVLFPRELVERYGMYDCHIGMRRLCDWDLWLRFMKYVPFIVVDELISEVYESNPGSLGLTVPWDLSLFRYLHDIPRNALLTPGSWRDYEVDSLHIGEVELVKDFRRRVYEEQILPYYLRFRTNFPHIEGLFRVKVRESQGTPKTVLYTKNLYDVSNDVTINHFDPLTNRRGSYKSHYQVLPQIQPHWPSEADILLLLRVVEGEGEALLKRALADGVPVGFYLDDDLLTFHEFGPQFDYLAPGTPYHNNLGRFLSQVDVVCVTNQFVAESVAPYNPRIVPHTNCVPHDWLPSTVRRRNPSRPLRIGYVGSGYRQEEFTLIWEALQRISRKYGDQLAFEFWGLDISSFPALASPTVQVPFTFSYFEYLARLREAHFDVLLTPLLDHPRPRLGKSLIKYFETAVAGALGIFSDVPPYAALPDRLTCLKVPNTAAAWYAALDEVLTMPAEGFDRLRQRCLRQVREEYTNVALIDRHEAAWRATEFHARTRGQRYTDGRPRVLYVLHSANLGGGELQLWRRLRAIREYGIEPIVVLPKVLRNTPEVGQLAEGLARERLQLEFVDYTCFVEPRSPTEFCSEHERPQVRELLAHYAPALVHTVTFIPTFGQICQEMGIPHVASLYAIDEGFRWAQGAPSFVHCTLNQSDSIRYARQWAQLLGTEWLCAREVAPEECFRLGFERSLRYDEGVAGGAYAGPLRLVMTGTLQPRKRQAEAIEAVGRLRREGVECRLDLYGSTHFFPDYYQQCRDLVDVLDLQERVVFRGFTNDVTAALAEADILLCPSTFESFPNAIREAMAAGVLVVATPVGGIPELIIDQQTGMLCADTGVEALVERIRRAAALGREEYCRIVEAARHVARVELHPQRAVNDLLSLYLRALEVHTSSGEYRRQTKRPVLLEGKKRKKMPNFIDNSRRWREEEKSPEAEVVRGDSTLGLRSHQFYAEGTNGVQESTQEQDRGMVGNARKAQVVCVLGMHRSGTSLVTRIANLLGVYLGPDEHLMKPAEVNPKGFWEHQLFVDLNEQILSRLGGSWHEPPAFSPGWESAPELADLRQRARALIREDFAAVNLWGWKDPRACLTLPFWKRLLPRMRYVVCFRNPLDIAQSVQRQHGFPFEKCTNIWLAYMRSVLEHTAGESRLFHFYEDYMDNWRGELGSLARFLGMPGLAEQEYLQQSVREFIEDELRHYHTSLVDTVDDPRLGFPAKAMYMVLRTCASFRPEGDGSDGNEVSHTFEEALNIFSADAVRAQANLDFLQSQVVEQQRQVAEKEEELETLITRQEYTAEELRQALAARETDLTQLRQALATREGELAQLQTALTEVRTERSRQRQVVEELGQVQILLAATQAQVMELEARAEVARQTIVEKEGALTTLQTTVTESQKQLAMFRDKGRTVAAELDVFRRRRATRWLSRFRPGGDQRHEIDPAFQQLKDDSLLFTPNLKRFRLQPSRNLQYLPFLAYPLELGRPNCGGVLLAPILDLPASQGRLGIEIVSPDNTIVAQSLVPFEQIDERVPTRFVFSPIADSDRGRFWLRVFVRDVETPVRIFEWRKYGLGGLSHLQTRAFCGFLFQ